MTLVLFIVGLAGAVVSLLFKYWVSGATLTVTGASQLAFGTAGAAASFLILSKTVSQSHSTPTKHTDVTFTKQDRDDIGKVYKRAIFQRVTLTEAEARFVASLHRSPLYSQSSEKLIEAFEAGEVSTNVATMCAVPLWRFRKKGRGEDSRWRALLEHAEYTIHFIRGGGENRVAEQLYRYSSLCDSRGLVWVRDPCNAKEIGGGIITEDKFLWVCTVPAERQLAELDTSALGRTILCDVRELDRV